MAEIVCGVIVEVILSGKITNKKILTEIESVIFDAERFSDGSIIVIEKINGKIGSHPAKNKYSYQTYIENFQNFLSIKVEGLERNKILKKSFGPRVKDIHLFYNHNGGFSFDWHKDSLNVILKVLKGKKTVWIGKHRHILSSGQEVYIPKRVPHKVSSSKDTWALSIGLK